MEDGKKWKHIAVRPKTFNDFRRLKAMNFRSDDAFQIELLKIYKLSKEVKNVQ